MATNSGLCQATALITLKLLPLPGPALVQGGRGTAGGGWEMDAGGGQLGHPFRTITESA